jgi:hypothetical protein
MAAATAGGIAGYAALSVTVNGVPPIRPFPGWVAVLEPVTELDEQVRLEVLSGLDGSHPLVGYTVAARGSRPYNADLLIGGASSPGQSAAAPGTGDKRPEPRAPACQLRPEAATRQGHTGRPRRHRGQQYPVTFRSIGSLQAG